MNLKDLTTESHWYTRIFLVDSIHRIVGREIKTLNVGGKEKKPLKRQINLFSCMTLEGKTDGVPLRSVVTFQYKEKLLEKNNLEKISNASWFAATMYVPFHTHT